MRWASLLSTVLLAVAGVMAPRLLFKSIGLDQQSMLASVGAVKQVTSAQAVDDRLMAQLKGLQSGETESVSLEQMAAVQDVLKNADPAGKMELGSALMDSFKKQRPLGETFQAGVLRDAEKVRAVYRQERETVLLALVMLGGACLLVAVLGAFPFGRAPARFFLSMVFALASYWMVGFSIAAAVFFWASSLNPWPVLPGEALAAPAALMLLCGLFVRQLDPNYPMWNAFLRALGAPILSCLAVAGAPLVLPQK